MTHVPTSPSAGSAKSKSPSQPRADAAEADRPQPLVERPVRRVDPHPGDGHDHGGHGLGEEEHGAEAGDAAHAPVREQRGEHQPEEHGQDRVEDDQLQRVHERGPDGRVARARRVVLEPDPRADGSARPSRRRTARPCRAAGRTRTAGRRRRPAPGRGRRSCAARPAPARGPGARPPRPRAPGARTGRGARPGGGGRRHGYVSASSWWNSSQSACVRSTTSCGVIRPASISWKVWPMVWSIVGDDQSG